MLDIHRTDSVPDTKIYFSHSILPTCIDPQNVSTKKKPFSTFSKQRFSHTLDLILPEEIYDIVEKELYRENGVGDKKYAKVHMQLGEVLESEFLDQYVRQGNIMMLSEGRPLVDNVFSLYDGTLRLELDRPTYERCGLQGISIEDGGRKHQKSRWVVEFNLRDKAMRHGKGKFERLMWACRNVLDQSLTWLFYNFNPSSAESLAEGKEMLSKHAPKICSIEPSVIKMRNVLVPKLSVHNLASLYEEEDALSLLEYCRMLSLDSPRLSETDDIDPHLSRYEVPDFEHGTSPRSMVCVRWRGFIPSSFARDLFLVVRRLSFRNKSGKDEEGDVDMEGDEKRENWFAVSAEGFGEKNAWTAMQFAGRETLVWEVES
ncbi:hypothetical protein P153DRAFT_286318 [Dothidotthia symphoricarpi CBS 119687]|uniref:Uncharacterized protein n=1 Tax=Dothidotthia symphoricarpi CBS 119687 TaxID=1392245 RepID=A0A6A6AI85_9PLEO|nr:uncharacterized protein P153DRAFT_286318 [Dothidotthia symphoricarpi CBS 119687]KAF2131520.1 hypothetical protein P153DRAFT_286318 [Dothidotthia symphoricarpi CBS 119687]